MNIEEAQQILAGELQYFKDILYMELIDRVGENTCYEKKAGSCSYQIEITILWDSTPYEAIRIIGSIDDGGLRAFIPLTESVLKLSQE